MMNVSSQPEFSKKKVIKMEKKTTFEDDVFKSKVNKDSPKE